MYFDNLHFGLPLDSPAGHMPWLGTTVNPGDVLLTQPSSGMFQPDGITHNVTDTHSFGGYPIIGDEALQSHLTVWSSQSMNYEPLDLSFDINEEFTRQLTGAVRPVRRMFRGVRVDGPVSTPCQWQSQGSPECGQEITGETVPKHLANHGIRNMPRGFIAQCCWRECGAIITRQSLTRHLREVHLGLKRKPYACTSSTALVAEVH